MVVLESCFCANARHRHALDFRLMANSQVLITDASNSLYFAGEPKSTIDSSLLLQPIPDFRSIVSEVRKGIIGSEASRRVVSIDIGIICHTSAVGVVGRALHERVQKRMKVVQAGVVKS